MTKKAFKELCNSGHEYGHGKNKHNAMFFDWVRNDDGVGFKYGVAMSIVNGNKKELFDAFYNWVVKGIDLPYYIRYKYANTDNQRFKTPICLNF